MKNRAQKFAGKKASGKQSEIVREARRVAREAKKMAREASEKAAREAYETFARPRIEEIPQLEEKLKASQQKLFQVGTDLEAAEMRYENLCRDHRRFNSVSRAEEFVSRYCRTIARNLTVHCENSPDIGDELGQAESQLTRGANGCQGSQGESGCQGVQGAQSSQYMESVPRIETSRIDSELKRIAYLSASAVLLEQIGKSNVSRATQYENQCQTEVLCLVDWNTLRDEHNTATQAVQRASYDLQNAQAIKMSLERAQLEWTVRDSLRRRRSRPPSSPAQVRAS